MSLRFGGVEDSAYGFAGPRGSPFAEDDEDAEDAEDAELIVSELSANAILHTASGRESGSFHLAVAVLTQVVAVSVTGNGETDTAPKIEHQDQDAEHARGHGMVSAIAHRIVGHDSEVGTITAELFTDTGRGGHPVEDDARPNLAQPATSRSLLWWNVPSPEGKGLSGALAVSGFL